MSGLDYIEFFCNNFFDTLNRFASGGLSVANLPCDLVKTSAENIEKIYNNK